MYNYLPTGTAQYTGETLTISPQSMMSEIPNWNQDIDELDDGTHVALTHTSTVQYTIVIQFPALTAAQAATIKDLFSNASKTMGGAKSFYFLHPTDGRTYVVRFPSRMEHQITYIHAIAQLTLWVEAVKAEEE